MAREATISPAFRQGRGHGEGLGARAGRESGPGEQQVRSGAGVGPGKRDVGHKNSARVGFF